MDQIMDVLDRYNKKGVDKAKLYHLTFVERLIESGYKPPRFPFLVHIERCWSKIQSKIN